jgi:hypothetical protein
VVQEACLAPESACLYGSQELKLLPIIRAARWMNCKHHLISFHFREYIGLENAEKIWALADTEHGLYKEKDGKTPDLLYLLLSLRDFKTSDPRDHLFATLGLYQEFQPGDLPAGLRANYTKSLAIVLVDATHAVIQNDAQLRSWMTTPRRAPMRCSSGRCSLRRAVY